MGETNIGARRAFHEFRTECMTMLDEIQIAIDSLEGQELVDSISQTVEKYGIVSPLA